MDKRKKDADRWADTTRQGYCYHSPIRSYKTETLVKKWQEGDGSSKKLATIAFELSFRDPALALKLVKAHFDDPRFSRRKATLRLCLHHVADADTARALFASDGFDPDALHLRAFSVLLDDFVDALPGLGAAEAEGQLRRLGFLDGPIPNPMVDGPHGSPAEASSSSRYGEIVVRFLKRIFDAPALVVFRVEILEHLRRTYADDAYVFLLERWRRGDVSAVDAFAAVPRLEWSRAEEILSRDGLDRLVRGFVAALAEAPARFEAAVLDAGWLPGSCKRAPQEHAISIAIAFLESERHGAVHGVAVDALLSAGEAGARAVIDRAKQMPVTVLVRAAAMLPYAEIRARLERDGFPARHQALTAHPGAPPDLGLLAEAEEALARDAADGCKRLARLATSQRHPQRGEALGRLIALAAAGPDARLRRQALYYLGETRDPRAAPRLFEAAADATLADARISIFAALANVADERSVPQLRRLVADFPGLGAEYALQAALRRPF